MYARVKLSCLSLLLAGACSSQDTPADVGAGLDSGTVDAGQLVDAGPEPCDSWLIEYALMDSKFEIRNTPFNAGDAVNAIGPGRVRLRFSGDDSGPKPGPVLLLEYAMKMQFEVAMVATDINVQAGPDDCGVAMGTRTSSSVTWGSPIVGYHSAGTVTCMASEFLCGAAGLPLNMAVSKDTTTNQDLSPFVFPSADDFGAFTMSEVEVPNEDPGDTFLSFSGVEVSRRCAAIPPNCN